MKVAAVCLLLFSVINLQGGESVSYTNGFPTRLVYSISSIAGPSMRLISDMNFTCNGVIVGYRAAGVQGSPVIQVWRKNGSLYSNTTAGIVIDGDLCTGGLEMCTDLQDDQVLCCDLNQTITNVSVQPGDILGLKLPRNSGLAFAASSRAPTNYVFGYDSSSPLDLSSASNKPAVLPQTSLQIEPESHSSSKDCVSGFPDIPVSEVGRRTNRSRVTTLLIPEMNFTCNASIVGFIVTGENLYRQPYSKIQIWRNQTSAYYQVGSGISMNFDSSGPCVASRAYKGRLLWCILRDTFKISIQPDDILGIELPATADDVEIFFTRGGPVNYVFEHQISSSSSVNLSSHGNSSQVKQLPQIVFNLTSDHCLSGFPSTVILQGNGRGERNANTTRLFPDMKFGCFGTIVQVSAAVVDDGGQESPKIQIWRENNTLSRLYHMINSSDILVRGRNPPCYQYSLSNGVFQCTLREDLRISVQPGDFLGLEIPPIDSDDLEIHFKPGGPTNLVFQGQLGSIVDLSTEPHATTNDEPQITFLVVLDEGRNSCPSADTSITAGLTTKTGTASNSVTKESISARSSTSTSGAITGGVIGGVIAILLVVGIVLMVAVLVQRRHKQHVDESNVRPNPAYGVSSRGTVQSDYDTVDGISLNPAYGVSHQDMPQDNDEAPDYMIVC